jgi:hypothetical protein
MRDEGSDVLTVHVAERMRPYLVDRLRAAAKAGRGIHVATPLQGLYDGELLDHLTSVDAQLHLVRGLNSVDGPAPVLACLADEGITVEPEVRQRLAATAWNLSRAKDISSYLKGRRLEGLLCFLLSQIEDFRVVERNLRTDTEELDAVVQQGRVHGSRCWSEMGAPFIIVEAKNWTTKVTQTEASVLRVKMQGRRGNVRLGVLVGANGFTSDAREQEMRFASDDLTIAFIGPDELDKWIAADDGDDYLEQLVRRAILR